MHMKEAYRDNALYQMEWVMWIRMRHVIDKESYKWVMSDIMSLYDLHMKDEYVVLSSVLMQEWVAWLIHAWVLSYIYICEYICDIHMCAITHSYVCHDSFICVPWLIHIWAMTHLYMSTIMAHIYEWVMTQLWDRCEWVMALIHEMSHVIYNESVRFAHEGGIQR